MIIFYASHLHPIIVLILYLIETPFNSFANRADPDQTALVRAVWSTLFAYGKLIIYYGPTLVDLTSHFFVLCTNVIVYLYNYHGLQSLPPSPKRTERKGSGKQAVGITMEHGKLC